MKHNKRGVLGYLAVAIALAVVIGGVSALARMEVNAEAEAVTVSEKATVVESPFTQAVRDVRESVVGVSNYGMSSRGGTYFNFGYGRGFDQLPGNGQSAEVLQGSGSGVVIAQGFVLTNYHVVEDATTLKVTAGESTYTATLAGYDEALDIAVLKVDGLTLTPVVIGDSDLLNIGDWAICIGNPLSFTGTTTVGVISGLNREITSATRDIYGRRTENVNVMIQTDAAINAGNSGGGMFNVAGELVGIPSMKYTGSFYSSTSVEGIGMAIPINAAKPLIAEALSGQVSAAAPQPGDNAGAPATAENKPRIGVTVSNMDVSNTWVSSGFLPTGAYVTNVEVGSPAEKAGIVEGDIIVEVDGEVITSTSQMVSILQAKEVGQTAAIKIFRVDGLDSSQNPIGNYMDLTVELALLDAVKQ